MTSKQYVTRCNVYFIWVDLKIVNKEEDKYVIYLPFKGTIQSQCKQTLKKDIVNENIMVKNPKLQEADQLDIC